MLGNASRPLAALVFVSTTALFAVPGEAQNMQWPGDPPQQKTTAPWPSAPAAAPTSTPAAAAPTPLPGMSGMSGMPGSGAPMTPVPQAGGLGGGGGAPPCMAEFSKLQAETDKQGKAAKDASKRKASREEMCTHLKSFAAAIGKWAKFTADNASSCGIPGKIVDQIKTGAANIAKSREQVCSGGMAGPGRPATPTLSEALGTTDLSVPEATRPSIATGTFDTLTGTTFGR